LTTYVRLSPPHTGERDRLDTQRPRKSAVTPGVKEKNSFWTEKWCGPARLGERAQCSWVEKAGPKPLKTFITKVGREIKNNQTDKAEHWGNRTNITARWERDH